MSTQQPESTPESPYPRENYFGDLADPPEDLQRGHENVDGTDAAAYLAYQHLSQFTDLVCGRSLAELGEEVPLSEPTMHLPKEQQRELGPGGEIPEVCPDCIERDDRDGTDLKRVAPLKQECQECGAEIDDDRELRIIEYRQHRHRRRINEKTGWINWGESTSTAVPEVDKDTYIQAVDSYLRANGVSAPHIDAWQQYAHRLWHDPEYCGKTALTKFIARKREYDQRLADPSATAQIPD